MLDVILDRDAEIPIGVQLAWALRARIRDGRFKPEQRLPGLRELAAATGVNVNTARSVYQRLEQEGLIDSQQGSGTFVASTPWQPSAVAKIAADAAREAQETGVDPREVAAALYVSPASLERPDGAVRRRRALREQIASLERTLGELEVKLPGIVPPSHARDDRSGPALLDDAGLERVRGDLLGRLAALQVAVDGLGSGEPAPQGEVAPKEAPTAAPAKGRAPRRRAATRPAPAGA